MPHASIAPRLRGRAESLAARGRLWQGGLRRRHKARLSDDHYCAADLRRYESDLDAPNAKSCRLRLRLAAGDELGALDRRVPLCQRAELRLVSGIDARKSRWAA